jgi:hypothetical protein
MGFERGITIPAGLPVPITTPTHGAAFDIADRNLARVDAPQRSSPAIPARAPLRARSWRAHGFPPSHIASCYRVNVNKRLMP